MIKLSGVHSSNSCPHTKISSISRIFQNIYNISESEMVFIYTVDEMRLIDMCVEDEIAEKSEMI